MYWNLTVRDTLSLTGHKRHDSCPLGGLHRYFSICPLLMLFVYSGFDINDTLTFLPCTIDNIDSIDRSCSVGVYFTKKAP